MKPRGVYRPEESFHSSITYLKREEQILFPSYYIFSDTVSLPVEYRGLVPFINQASGNAGTSLTVTYFREACHGGVRETTLSLKLILESVKSILCMGEGVEIGSRENKLTGVAQL
ncbi:hypothetical protein CEXT_723491 [Caerostris extrusa]|uniref:Uncharacterized protein n=1 Tax=Caerostris extrusa TaxID=172846 RepID=A0AAV4QL54_CAEEX|nr:hypothetical protein CEXT_723491 [Caerostris extrusa]